MRRPLVHPLLLAVCSTGPSQGITKCSEKASSPSQPSLTREVTAQTGVNLMLLGFTQPHANNVTFTNPFQWGFVPLSPIPQLFFHPPHMCCAQEWNICCRAPIETPSEELRNNRGIYLLQIQALKRDRISLFLISLAVSLHFPFLCPFPGKTVPPNLSTTESLKAQRSSVSAGALGSLVIHTK